MFWGRKPETTRENPFTKWGVPAPRVTPSQTVVSIARVAPPPAAPIAAVEAPPLALIPVAETAAPPAAAPVVEEPPQPAIAAAELSREAREASVVEWKEDRIEDRPGLKVGAGALYADYLAWCAIRSETAVSQARFGRILKGVLLVQSERIHNRVWYFRIGLRRSS
jgi:hypothetical protein